MKYAIRLLVIYSMFLYGCTGSAGFKEIRDIKNSEWAIAKKEVFVFENKDTLSKQTVNYLVRNSVSYPYYNLYLSHQLSDPNGKVISSGMDEVILFNQKTGKPYGDGLGDIFDNRVVVPKLTSVVLNKMGKYKLTVTHNMRPDPLTGIMSIGLEVLADAK